MVKGLALLIVDDERALADAVARELNGHPRIATVDICESVADATRAVTNNDYHVALVDVRLADGDGITLVRDLAIVRPSMRCIVITGFADPTTGAAAIRAGAVGFLGKDISLEDLGSAVEVVAAGGTSFSPYLLAHILRVLRDQWRIETLLRALSAREYEVLILMVEGYSRSAIATALYLSLNTVRSHARSVFAKLGVHSSLEAVNLARRAGIRPTIGAARH